MGRSPVWSTRDDGLKNVQDAIESPSPVNPAMAVELRAHSMGTRAEARQTRGSSDGNGGPRMMMLAGNTSPGDRGVGMFVWDDTSTAADDEGATTLEVYGVANGRWRRAQLPGAPRLITGITANATPASIWLDNVPPLSVADLFARVAMFDITGNQAAVYWKRAAVYADAAGNLTVTAYTVSADYETGGAAAADAVFTGTATPGQIALQVTGIAARTCKWQAWITVLAAPWV